MSQRGEKLWALIEDNYLGLDAPALEESFARHLEYSQAKTRFTATPHDAFKSACYAVRDRIMEQWNDTQRAYYEVNAKRVYYLSLEFLLGRALGNALINLGIRGEMRQALEELGQSLESLEEQEPDAGLGNGGLGRLAACYLDSLATLQLPGYGYGIRYDYGIFEQQIRDGQQVEHPDPWLRFGHPWEIVRPEYQYRVRFGGHVHQRRDETGKLRHELHGTTDVFALAYDVPIPGYRNGTVNTLRLWSAKATEDFALTPFNQGDYIGAMYDKVRSETISSVLYPKDDLPPGRELRLKQEYFFVSATIQDILRRHKVKNPTVGNLADKVAIQLNDTHPALAVLELLRLLLDEEGCGWDEAWAITRACCAYTNHTVLPEALETWRVELFGRLLPRHLELAYEVNRRFLEEVRTRFPGDEERVRRMSLFQEGGDQRIRMAALAMVGSHKVNGVSRLHSRLLETQLFADFVDLWPGQIVNKTNGITPRRWLLLANPELAALIEARIGAGWITDLERLQELAPHAADPDFRQRWRAVKQANKHRFADLLATRLQRVVDPHSLFDCQAKRIHEYKRQLLNVLHALVLLRRLRAGEEVLPRTLLFAGKAAPGYHAAKLIIRLIHAVDGLVRRDPRARERLQLVFVPNYGVSLAQRLLPATELSQQISTAGLEASGTGNMKFALNGALTIGTLDGANVEIREAVGADNFFLFGLTVEEIASLHQRGYDPRRLAAQDEELGAVLEMLVSGELSPAEPQLFRPLYDSLLAGGDRYLLLADFRSYLESQEAVARLYRDPEEWTRRAILNAAAMGRFSSDRAIGEYAREIWEVRPVTPAPKAGRRVIGG